MAPVNGSLASSLPSRIAWEVSRLVGVPVTDTTDNSRREITFRFGRGLVAYAVSVSEHELANMDSVGVSWLVTRLAAQFKSEESRRLAGALGDIASGFAAGSGIAGLVPYSVAVAQRGGDRNEGDGGLFVRDRSHPLDADNLPTPAEGRARRNARRPTPPDVTHAPAFGRRKIRLEGKD